MFAGEKQFLDRAGHRSLVLLLPSQLSFFVKFSLNEEIIRRISSISPVSSRGMACSCSSADTQFTRGSSALPWGDFTREEKALQSSPLGKVILHLWMVLPYLANSWLCRNMAFVSSPSKFDCVCIYTAITEGEPRPFSNPILGRGHCVYPYREMMAVCREK